jgi:predicted kinase
MVVLVGIPGSGKSFVAEQLREKGWVIVSQDELGNRKECEKQAARALQQGRSVLIDRTNFDKQQRSHWLRIAGNHRAAATAVYLDVDIDTCKARVMSRSGHPTLKPSPLSLEIVDRFLGDLQIPTEDEGFRRVVVLRQDEPLSSRLTDIIG